VTKSERAAEGTLCGGGFKNVKQNITAYFNNCL